MTEEAAPATGAATAIVVPQVNPLLETLLAAPEGGRILTLSHSRLAAFSKCPYRFRLKYIDKVPEAYVPAQAVALAHGKLVHKAIELVIRYQEKTGSLEEVSPRGISVEALEEVRKEEEVPDPDARLGELEEVMTQWVEHERSVRPYPTVLLDGEELRETLTEVDGVRVDLLGLPDRILFATPRDYIIIDHKTGKSSYGVSQLRDSLQLRMYAYLWLRHLSRNPGRARHQGDVRIRIRYSKVSKDGVREVETYLMPWDLYPVEDHLKKLAKDILTSNFEPHPGRMCSLCPYRAQGCSFSAWRPTEGGP